ncbi:E3 ubiquitin-protein ligase COP1-like isoform X2 [Argentina anserina]|uniref:E3 ubiquitin-protein ligase COP1-like isoform X2 n=1 Tax=Argentina anserina TaxID=57926 RepID=UPI00217639DA|nr:E3 ubiquitin-protein ligase COP1-like isoform X2 [Potentilla anserina]
MSPTRFRLWLFRSAIVEGEITVNNVQHQGGTCVCSHRFYRICLGSHLKRRRGRWRCKSPSRAWRSCLGYCIALRGKSQKLEELNERQADLDYNKKDMIAVERCRVELYSQQQGKSVRLRLLGDEQQRNDIVHSA